MDGTQARIAELKSENKHKEIDLMGIFFNDNNTNKYFLKISCFD